MNQTINSRHTNCRRTGRKHLRPAVPVFFLLVILFFGILVRFEGITAQGVSVCPDDINYINEAKLWAEGSSPEFLKSRHYRPATYFLQGMAIRIFGYNDYSIKMLHCLMDIINILLIFLIAALLAENLWVGTISSLLYAFLPSVVMLARREMVHVESAFFVMWALFFFILFDKKKPGKSIRIFFLFISGFCMGLASNTHIDLAFLAPGFVLFLFLKSYNSRDKKESFKKFLILAFVYTAAFFTPYLLGFLLFGIGKTLQVFINEISIVNDNMEARFGRISKPRLFLRLLSTSFTYFFRKQIIPFSILLAGAIFIMIFRKVKKERDPLSSYLPLILMFSYVLLYPSFVSQFGSNAGRLFLPLVPMIIVIIALWYSKIFEKLTGKYALIIFVSFFLMVFILNPKEKNWQTKYKSVNRILYDNLEKHVNPGNKLLIAPVTAHSQARAAQSDLYFGENALYMVHLPIKNEYSLESLRQVLQDKKIRYLFVENKIDSMFSDPNFSFGKGSPIQRWLRNEKISDFLKKDLDIIRAYIQCEGGLAILKNRFGWAYYLTGDESVRKKFGMIINGSFEYWWKGYPLGGWVKSRGKVSRSNEAGEGLSSLRFEPGQKEGSKLAWVFKKFLPKEEIKLKVRLDAKAGEPGKLLFFFVANISGKRQKIAPGEIHCPGGGEWTTMAEDFVITPGMRRIVFYILLQPQAREPAFIDNLSIERIN